MTTLGDIIYDLQASLPSENDTKVQKILKYILLPESIHDNYLSYKYSSHKESLNKTRSDLFYSVLTSEELKKFRKEKFVKVVNDGSKCSQLIIDYGTLGTAYIPYDKDQRVRNKNIPLYLSKNFDISKLGDLFAEVVGNKIFLDRKIHQDGSSSFSFEAVTCENDVVTFDQHRQCLDMISEPGTYLFYGPAGTGKSTFVFAQDLDNKRCIKIGSRYFSSLEMNEVKILFLLFKPEILLLEELDKHTPALDDMLLFLERIRKQKMTIIFTANSIRSFDEALIRPGRIDGIAEFHLPTKEETFTLVDKFCIGNQDTKQKLSDAMFGAKLSHSYIVSLSKKIQSDDPVKLEKMIVYIEYLKKIKK